jgi:hypothetical protein
MGYEAPHRIYMMHAINAQFRRIVEEGGLTSVHSERLLDMTFHLMQWWLTPACGGERDPLSEDCVRVLVKGFQTNKTAAALALYRMMDIGQYALGDKTEL